MQETLWISLPEQETENIKNIVSYIDDKSLSPLTIKQLLQKLIDNKAYDWKQVLIQYNKIASVHNIDVSKMLERTLAVNNQFLRHEAALENKVFSPNELLSLIILCYSNPLLIGPQLCKVLKENDADGVAREILEDSAFVRAAGRVVPWASNLRLLNYALYANDTSVQLPMGVLTRIRKAAIAKSIKLVEIGQLTNVNNTSTAIGFERLQQGELLDSSGHRGTIVPFEEPSSFRFNAANNLRINEFLASTLFLLHMPVVSPVLRNMGRDIANGFSRVSHYTGGFFSRNLANINTNAEEQEALLLHDEAKP